MFCWKCETILQKQLKKSNGKIVLKRSKRKQSNATEQWYLYFRTALGKEDLAQLVDVLSLRGIFYRYRCLEASADSTALWMLTKDLSFSERPNIFGESQEALRQFDQRIKDYQTALAEIDIRFFGENKS